MTLDSKVSFIDHVNEKIKICKQHIGIVRFLSRYLSMSTQIQIYKTFIRPHLDVIYQIPHFRNAFDSTISLHPLMERIERVQYHAALAITGCWRGTNTDKLYEELGLESLTDRRWSRRLVQLFKIRNNLTPEYLQSSLPSAARNRSLRNNDETKYQDIMCNTSRYQNSFFPDAIKSWNNMGIDFCSTPSLGKFKNDVFKLVRPVSKSVFGVHDPLGVPYLFQLRVGLSPLKHHKKRHDFQDTPNDCCNCLDASEDTAHFLLYCHLHSLPRVNLQNTVMNILSANNLRHLYEEVDIYLYGHEALRYADNKTILLATIKFIKESKRFT